jgi:short-subunit dehydrogenase
MQTSFQKQYGPYALIAGASQGIGEAFAREIAAKGVNVILLARREELLKKLANKLQTKFDVEAIPFPYDLTNSNLFLDLSRDLNDFEINLLVYNAALSTIGRFSNQSLEKYETAINLNCRAPTILARHFGEQMIQRGQGGIILMSSLTAFQGSPYVAVYGATKAFNLNLAEALWKEWNKKGVIVKACTAGATQTPNFEASNPKKINGLNPPLMKPDQVAQEALASLSKNKPFHIPGCLNKLSSFFMRRLLSRKQAINIIGNFNKKMYL